MRKIRLTVNGEPASAAVEPRTQLADFLRDALLLTGTHQGCEHGVCGACTLLIDGVPARSCIAYAAAFDGAEITTIEGMESDDVAAQLREAFSREHALQCGFCTPGMLITARDIVLRLPDADERRIRLELSGNLCRCTGYVGIVRAIRQVMERRKAAGGSVVPPMRRLGPVGARPATPAKENAGAAVIAPQAPPLSMTGPSGAVSVNELGVPGSVVTESFKLAEPLARVWRGFKDLELVAACLPGAALTAPPRDGRIEGRLRIKLGPITAGFAGQGSVEWDDAGHRGMVRGGGRDSASGSQARGEIMFALDATRDGGTRVDLRLAFSLAGPLAQFSRGAIVEELAARLTAEFARNLEARLAAPPGQGAPAPAAALDAGSLLRAVVWSRIKDLFRRIRPRR